jgi:hypothetical protein
LERVHLSYCINLTQAVRSCWLAACRRISTDIFL